MTDPTARDGVIEQAQQQRLARDTLILQKVNYAHREAFKTRFPGQCEHLLRLTAERLHKMMLNTPTELGDPATWPCTSSEIRDLAEALHLLYMINKDMGNEFQSLSTPSQRHE